MSGLSFFFFDRSLLLGESDEGDACAANDSYDIGALEHCGSSTLIFFNFPPIRFFAAWNCATAFNFFVFECFLMGIKLVIFICPMFDEVELVELAGDVGDFERNAGTDFEQHGISSSMAFADAM